MIQLAGFNESWLGKFEPDDNSIFCLKAATIRRFAGARKAVNARRSRRAAARPANKVKIARPETPKPNGLLA
ncbi:MAG: hypothetical protein WBF43_02875 [Methylocella sp.]